MKCYLVEDLLPNYVDGACSEQTEREIREHLESCAHCREIVSQMKTNMEDVLLEEEQEVSIEPMKKVRRRLRRNKAFIITLSVLLLVVLALVSVLTYGQLCKKGQSFESVYEYFHMRHIGKAFAKGDVEALLAVVENGWICNGSDEFQALYNAYSSENEYQRDITEQIKNRYEQYFQGKHLKFQDIAVDYSANVADLWENTITVTMNFSADNATLYGICLRKNARGKFYIYDVFQDTTVTEATYVSEGDDSDSEEDEDSEEEENTNTPKELDNNEESLFYHLVDKDQEMTFMIMRDKVAIKFKRLINGEEDPLEYPFAEGFQYENETKEERENRAKKWEKSLEKLTQKQYYLKTMNMDAKAYDREKHYFIYKIVLEVEDQKTKECAYLSVDAYRWKWGMVLIPDSERLLGEISDAEAKELMEDFFAK